MNIGRIDMRHLLLLSVLLLGVSWATAQNQPHPTSPNQTDSSQTTASGTESETTVQGCLSGSDGNYILTDKNGSTFQLTGDTAKLSEHVGHEVKVSGTSSSASAPPSGGAASGTTQQPSSSQAIQVASVKHVSKTCQSGSTPR
jgi:hypothetical protein